MFFFLDIIVVGLCVAHGFGRIGCFFGGCCYGKTVEPHTFLSIYYPINKLVLHMLGFYLLSYMKQFSYLYLQLSYFSLLKRIAVDGILLVTMFLDSYLNT